MFVMTKEDIGRQVLLRSGDQATIVGYTPAFIDVVTIRLPSGDNIKVTNTGRFNMGNRYSPLNVVGFYEEVQEADDLKRAMIMQRQT